MSHTLLSWIGNIRNRSLSFCWHTRPGIKLDETLEYWLSGMLSWSQATSYFGMLVVKQALDLDKNL